MHSCLCRECQRQRDARVLQPSQEQVLLQRGEAVTERERALRSEFGKEGTLCVCLFVCYDDRLTTATQGPLKIFLPLPDLACPRER